MTDRTAVLALVSVIYPSVFVILTCLLTIIPAHLAEASISSRMHRSSAPSPKSPTHDYELRSRTPCVLPSKRRKCQSNASEGALPARIKRARQKRHSKATNQSWRRPESASPGSPPSNSPNDGNNRDDAKDCHHKTELFRSTTATDENGAVLSFPLGAESWDNLSRLRQACSEMEHHLNIAKVRIWQLEQGRKAITRMRIAITLEMPYCDGWRSPWILPRPLSFWPPCLEFVIMRVFFSLIL